MNGPGQVLTRADGSTETNKIDMLYGLVVLRDHVNELVATHTLNAEQPYKLPNNGTRLQFGETIGTKAYNYTRGKPGGGYAPNGTDVKTEIVWRYVGLTDTVAVFKNKQELERDIQYRLAVINNARNVHWEFSGSTREAWNYEPPKAGWSPTSPLTITRKGINKGAGAVKSLLDPFSPPYKKLNGKGEMVFKYSTACHNGRNICALQAASQVTPNFEARALALEVNNLIDLTRLAYFADPNPAESLFNYYVQDNPLVWIPGDIGFFHNLRFSGETRDAASAGENVIYLGGKEPNAGNFSDGAGAFMNKAYFFAHTGDFNSNIRTYASWISTVEGMGGTKVPDGKQPIVDTSRYFLKQNTGLP